MAYAVDGCLAMSIKRPTGRPQYSDASACGYPCVERIGSAVCQDEHIISAIVVDRDSIGGYACLPDGAGGGRSGFPPSRSI